MRLPGLVLPGLALLALAVAAPATQTFAQNPIDQFEVAFQTREAQRRATISRTMGFSEDEASTFWPIYDAYRAVAKTHQLRRLRLIQRFSQSAVGMDAETAQAIMDAAIALDNEQQAAKEAYFVNLAPHFEGARYFRLYQLEVKLDAIFRAGWTGQIPLAVTEEELEALQHGMEAQQQEASLPVV